MTKFNLKQLTLASGIFGAVIFVACWASILIFPNLEIHRQLLLEMHFLEIWPLDFGAWFWGILCGFVWGASAGLVFGLIFNFFAPKKII